MLAVFEKSIAKSPKELGLPSSKGLRKSLSREQILENFRSSWNEPTVYNLANWNFMALSHDDYSAEHPRNKDLYYLLFACKIGSIVVIDDVFCMFIGTLENTLDLRRHYGLQRQATEAIIVVEAYKVLRDQAPYPTDQVIKDLHGDFAFVLFDAASGTLFAAGNRNGSIECHWGLAGDGSLVFSNNPNIIEEACRQSHSPFPADSSTGGCIFKNGSELIRFDHPLHKVRAIAYEDDDGNISRVIFQVDLYTRIHSIPRTGSAAN
ncbi:hypothetical protein TIFTF001_019976 [Ficus carica]|uniref:DUF3700 domain-containing protein n=1 Tax=Ficus carica TaxID=3494 RepID=A0AA88AR48_FICCA|nr:hypothetical protein TIFTF001_019976 [Ficus carica]